MVTSKIIESLRDDLASLRAAGAIDKGTLRAFDAICRPPMRKSGTNPTGRRPARSNGSTTQEKRRAGRV